MKKPTSMRSQRRTLVLRSETIAELTRVQLTKVAGGLVTWVFPCPPVDSNLQFGGCQPPEDDTRV